MKKETNISLLVVDDVTEIVNHLVTFLDKICPTGLKVSGDHTEKFQIVNNNTIGISEYFESVIKFYEPDILISDVSFEYEDEKGLEYGRELITYSSNLSKVIYLSKHSHLDSLQPSEAVICKFWEKEDGEAISDESLFIDTLKEAIEDQQFIEYCQKSISYSENLYEQTLLKTWKDNYRPLIELVKALASAIQKIEIGQNYRIFKFPSPLRMFYEKIYLGEDDTQKIESIKGNFKTAIRYFNKSFDVYQNNFSDIILKLLKDIVEKNKEVIFDKNRIAEYLISGSENYKVPIDQQDNNKPKISIVDTINNFKGYEPMLYANIYLENNDSFPRYRDHFYHTFHVFLLGNAIIEWLLDIGKKKDKTFITMNNDTFLLTWFFTSIFHDIGYIVSKAEKSISQFFESFFDEKRLDTDSLSSVLEKTKFQNAISFISSYGASKGNSKHSCINGKPDFCKKTHIESLLKSAFAYDKDHGVLSAVSFIDQYYNFKIDGIDDDKSNEYLNKIKINLTGKNSKSFTKRSIEEQIKFYVEAILNNNNHQVSKDFPSFIKVYQRLNKEVILPAAFSMAIHSKLYEKLGVITFEEDPLSFLLIFIDVCQEYDRPQGFNVKSSINNRVDLIGINYSKENIESINRVPYFDVILGIYNNKLFGNIFSQSSLVFTKYLSSSTVDFRLILVDMSKELNINDFFKIELDNGRMSLIESTEDRRIKLVSTYKAL
jgi:hypothetical protein